MREYLSELVGNDALRSHLGTELASGTMPHAYILHGPKGSGKHTLARLIAMALACQNRFDSALPLPCGRCPSCRKIAEGNCPDILTVKREEDKATMGVDVIRALRTDVPVLPNDLDCKIYVIEDAHTMTVPAQNAFLLTLEEPPPFVLFLLLCEDTAPLLETVRSRAPALRMQPVTDEQLRAYLLSPTRPAVARKASDVLEQDPDEFAALLRMAQGRIGRALELLEEKKRAPLLATREMAQTLCALLAAGNRSADLLCLLRTLDRPREQAVAGLGCVQQAVRDLIALSRCDTASLTFFTDREQALDLCAHFTTKRLLDVAAATDEALRALAINANIFLTLIHYHSRLTA